MPKQNQRGETYLVALAVVAEGSRLLVTRTGQGRLELPGQSIAEGEEAERRMGRLVSNLGLDHHPSQTLYLHVPFHSGRRSTEMAVIQVIRLSKARKLALSGGRFEPVRQLAKNPEASTLTRAVAKWLLEEAKRR